MNDLWQETQKGTQQSPWCVSSFGPSHLLAAHGEREGLVAQERLGEHIHSDDVLLLLSVVLSVHLYGRI